MRVSGSGKQVLVACGLDLVIITFVQKTMQVLTYATVSMADMTTQFSGLLPSIDCLKFIFNYQCQLLEHWLR